ncbi:hypothetical protein P153DRAFT_353197 [Dothidotthia symphoricarpi CBS 119687]|uniref:Uncharacterized protein n=1 Tax=Dothidotthia symphoricarpi CBS 119687 TaxID=1392245 RepID=A0A6A6ATV8_9PLEO|nr:uncharacterized protein P153DRAFT_353197 [Dothidotthia symphoricarpi CBS 119687]KAF2133981.1 hypothetical protein P153DRAFT_353197 [Dothidotthia symphoricarpi CBS 119687]
MAETITPVVTTVFGSSLTFLNIRPLTTVYTPPSSCVDRWIQPNPLDTVISSVLGYASRMYLSCQAGGIAPTYSPGVCPSGQRLRNITEYQFSNGGSDRAWKGICCSGCWSSFSTSVTAYRPGTVLIPTFYSYSTGISSYTVVSYNYELTTNTTILTTGRMSADAVVVYWQASDLPKFEPEYASALATHLGLTFTATTSAGTVHVETATPASTSGLPRSTSDPQPNEDPHGLSTGAKAGIGIGAACGALVLLAGIFFLYRRRKRTHSSDYRTSDMQQTADMPELLNANQFRHPR